MQKPERGSLGLGGALKARRLELGLRIEEVAARANVSFSTIVRAENGRGLQVTTLDALAKALETTHAALLDRASDAA